MAFFRLRPDSTALMVIDVQEAVFSACEHPCEVMQTMRTAIKGFQLLSLPIVVTEQYPKGLKHTVPQLKEWLGPEQTYLEKTTFSALADAEIKKTILAMPQTQWVVMGIEAHVCVLQTATDLLAAGKQVVVLNDCISSRSVYDFSTAIAELRDAGARVSSVETVLFDLIHDAKSPLFKKFSQLIKESSVGVTPCDPSSCCRNA